VLCAVRATYTVGGRFPGLSWASKGILYEAEADTLCSFKRGAQRRSNDGLSSMQEQTLKRPKSGSKFIHELFM